MWLVRGMWSRCTGLHGADRYGVWLRVMLSEVRQGVWLEVADEVEVFFDGRLDLGDG